MLMHVLSFAHSSSCLDLCMLYFSHDSHSLLRSPCLIQCAFNLTPSMHGQTNLPTDRLTIGSMKAPCWSLLFFSCEATHYFTLVRTYVRAYVRTDQLAFFNITQPYQFRFKRDKGQRWSNNLIQLT